MTPLSLLTRSEKLWNESVSFREFVTEAGSGRRTDYEGMADFTTFSDDELLRHMRDGSESAFTALYRRHHRSIYRFAYQMSGSAAVADEVTQEVFLALIRQPERFRQEQGPLGAFLHGIARNHVLKSLGRDRRYVSQDEDESGMDDLPASECDVLTLLMQVQERELLRQAVLSLPEVYREALVLCDIEELNYDDAAVRIGCPVGTVRSRLHRARALLAGKLKSAVPKSGSYCR